MQPQPGQPFGAAVPEPDWAAEPEGFVVEVAPGDRIHFLDWGGPDDAQPTTAGEPARDEGPAPGVLLIHGIGQTAWTWAPVARRLRRVRRVVAMDLRGHGLSDAPTWGYEPASIIEDVVAAAEGSGLIGFRMAAGAEGSGPNGPAPDPEPPIVLVGHGFGACVAAWAAAALGARCAGLVLVDGGWEDLRATSGMEPDEWLRGLDEPPEVLRSMSAYLADRAGFDPATWDADQERAARATVVEVPAGRVVAVGSTARHGRNRGGHVRVPPGRGPGRRLGADHRPLGRRQRRRHAGRGPRRHRAAAQRRRPPAPADARVTRRRPQPDALPPGRGDRRDSWRHGASRNSGYHPVVSQPERPSLTPHVAHLVSEIETEMGDLPRFSEVQIEGEGGFAEESGPVEDAVRQILAEIGEDPERPGLLGTPGRVHRMYTELTAGYHVDPDRLINGAIFDVGFSEMVLVRDIPFYSLCEHHLLPFFGTAAVAYIPRGKVIGLSKIPRLVEMYARRLQVQERLTQQIAEILQDRLEPQGVGVVLEATHLCAVMRGVRKPGTIMTTSAVLGLFRTRDRTRAEFFAHLARRPNEG